MKRNRIFRRSLIALVLGWGAAATKAQTITEFSIPTPESVPSEIVAGPDGNLWFTENQGNKIGRITPGGFFDEFLLPGHGPRGIAVGSDGNLWFTELGNKIGRITAAGEITEFSIPAPTSMTLPSITAGPDGSLWFTEDLPQHDGRIGRITTSGEVVNYSIPSAGLGGFSSPQGITAGPDGNLWFTEYGGPRGRISRISTGGVITVVHGFGVLHFPGRLAAGPDGNLWFTSNQGIGQITTDGEASEINSVGPSRGITTGPDGSLWFTEWTGNRIGRITTAGVITGFAIPTPGSNPVGIAAGPDGNLWFTESASNKIGRLTVSGVVADCTPDSQTLCLGGGRFEVTAIYRSLFASGAATAAGLSDSSGLFTFDNPDSVELVVKVLDACGIGSGFWVFAAGLTDQEVFLTVTDKKTRDVRTYSNPLGTTFVTVTDTSAFSSCP